MENTLSIGKLAQPIRKYACLQSKMRTKMANLLIDFHSLPMYNLGKEDKLIYFTTFFIFCQERKDLPKWRTTAPTSELLL
jgi:hypothetical protein